MHPGEQRNEEKGTSSRVLVDEAGKFEDPHLMLTLHPTVLQTELRYKAECEASGVDYIEPKFIETKSQRCYRRVKMKYSMDPTLQDRKAKYMRDWYQLRRKDGDTTTKMARRYPISYGTADGFNNPDLMRMLHPLVQIAELRYKEECEASGVEYKEPKFIETESQRYARRREMKYSMDPTLRVKQRVREIVASWDNPVVHQTELRYKAECEASGVEYKEPKFIETKSQRYARRREMKYSMDPTLRAKAAKYRRDWYNRKMGKDPQVQIYIPATPGRKASQYGG